MDFLRPKRRENRLVDVLADAEVDAEMGVDAGAAVVDDTLLVVALSSAVGVAAGDGLVGIFSEGEAEESVEPVRRGKLGLLKIALPIVVLSRWVLLVPVDEDAGGKGDFDFVLFVLKSVDAEPAVVAAVVAPSVDGDSVFASVEEIGVDLVDVDGAAIDGSGAVFLGGETEADEPANPNNLSYWLTWEDVVVVVVVVAGKG